MTRLTSWNSSLMLPLHAKGLLKNKLYRMRFLKIPPAFPSEASKRLLGLLWRDVKEALKIFQKRIDEINFVTQS